MNASNSDYQSDILQFETGANGRSPRQRTLRRSIWVLWEHGMGVCQNTPYIVLHIGSSFTRVWLFIVIYRTHTPDSHPDAATQFMQREYWHTPIAICNPSLPGLCMRSDQAPQTPESRLWTWPEIPTSAASFTQVEPALPAVPSGSCQTRKDDVHIHIPTYIHTYIHTYPFWGEPMEDSQVSYQGGHGRSQAATSKSSTFAPLDGFVKNIYIYICIYHPLDHFLSEAKDAAENTPITDPSNRDINTYVMILLLYMYIYIYIYYYYKLYYVYIYIYIYIYIILPQRGRPRRSRSEGRDGWDVACHVKTGRFRYFATPAHWGMGISPWSRHYIYHIII